MVQSPKLCGTVDSSWMPNPATGALLRMPMLATDAPHIRAASAKAVIPSFMAGLRGGRRENCRPGGACRALSPAPPRGARDARGLPACKPARSLPELSHVRAPARLRRHRRAVGDELPRPAPAGGRHGHGGRGFPASPQSLAGGDGGGVSLLQLLDLHPDREQPAAAVRPEGAQSVRALPVPPVRRAALRGAAAGAGNRQQAVRAELSPTSGAARPAAVRAPPARPRHAGVRQACRRLAGGRLPAAANGAPLSRGHVHQHPAHGLQCLPRRLPALLRGEPVTAQLARRSRRAAVAGGRGPRPGADRGVRVRQALAALLRPGGRARRGLCRGALSRPRRFTFGPWPRPGIRSSSAT